MNFSELVKLNTGLGSSLTKIPSHFLINCKVDLLKLSFHSSHVEELEVLGICLHLERMNTNIALARAFFTDSPVDRLFNLHESDVNEY